MQKSDGDELIDKQEKAHQRTPTKLQFLYIQVIDVHIRGV